MKNMKTQLKLMLQNVRSKDGAEKIISYIKEL